MEKLDLALLHLVATGGDSPDSSPLPNYPLDSNKVLSLKGVSAAELKCLTGYSLRCQARRAT
jgi:hypothetical protein